MGTKEHIHFYELLIDDSDPLALDGVDRDAKGFNEYRFYEGEWIGDWPEGVTVYVKGQHPENYTPGGLHWHLLSEKVRQVFERCGVEGAQFLPVTMKHSETGEAIGGYWVLNVLREVDALDWDHTRWVNPAIRDTDPYPHLNIFEVALRQEPLKGVDVFRLRIRNKGCTDVFISRRLKRCLDQAGATSGMKLKPIPAY